LIFLAEREVAGMVDVFSKAKRSEVMAGIRGKENKSTEKAMIAAMKKAGITGWRRHVQFKLRRPVSERVNTKSSRSRLVRPDFTFRSEKLVVFIDGCFWHMCPDHHFAPKQNSEFWARKLSGNAERDDATNELFRNKGWSVLRIWEHELRRPAGAISKLDIVLKTLRRAK
jgi:DNA mismatch endonuclease (patch repair protein)